jgi:FtsP/CotA-like multicopper oxidase with cupredoxin domain
LLATSATLEFFGNIPVVNGVTYGKYNVDRGIYRMRFIGGTDSRTWALRLKISNSNPVKYIPFWVIGTEQGFLNNPVKSEHLLIMPGERYDVLIDFNSAESLLDDGVSSAGPVNLANKRIVVENWAGDAPYGGETILAPENPQAAAFRSSDIPEVMIFDVSNNTAATSISTPSASLSLRPGAQITNLDATVTRNVSLVEIVDNYGRIMPTLDGRGFMEFPITELPRLNATEQWDIINTTVDAHPMHLHQVAFQLINREDINVLGADPVTQEPILDVQSAQLTPPYNSASYVGSGVVTPPADYEAGWKDTVVCPPAKVTRVRAKFDIPGLYVWHCHILSHEEHDMMRPLVVTTPVTDVTLSASALSQVTGSSPAEVQLTAQSANAVTGSSTGNGFEYEFVVTRGNTVISEQPTRLPAKFNSSIGDGFNMVRVASWTPPNRSGVYTITVNAKAMGPIDADPLSPTYNPVKSATLTYTMIDVPAVVAVTSSSPAGAYNAGKSINVTVTFNQPINSTNGLVIALSSGAAISTGPLANVSSFSGSYIVAAGQNTQALNVISITGTVTDALGANPVVNPTVVFGANISNNKTIAVDTVNPALTVLAPGDGTLTNSAQITVNGVVSDLNGIQLVTVNGANVPVGAAGTFSSVVPLVTGGNSITAVATDVAGNTTTLVRSVTLDQAVPNTLITPVAGTYSGTVTVSLTSESGAKIYYTTDGQIPSTSSALYSGPFVLTASATTTYTVQYFALDAAGNSEAVKSTPFTIHVSDLANASVVINNGATVTNSASVNLTLAATDLSSPIAKMMVACDGINFAAAEPFSTSRTCTLPAGDGLKTVAVKYIDGLQTIYDPVTAQITVDTVVPVTSATPGSGVFGSSVVVALTVNKAATIYYSVDGSIPTVHSTRYLTPLTLNSSSTAPITLMYFAVDQAGNAEQVKSVTYTLHTADLSQAVVSINNGALFTMSSTVSLSLAASDPNGIPQMQVACDGINYSAAEQFNPVRTCSLSAGDGVKTIAIKFIDGLGTVYPPIPAQITLDSVAAVTTVTPVGGVYSGSTAVSFSANETAKIYYTLDGTEPVESAANLYSGEFNLTPASTTQYQVKYFSVDQAGNRETTKTITYTVHISDLTGSISINNNVPYTAVSTVTLKLFAQDPAGVQWMQFSNDGISFTPLEAYATSKVWTLNPSDGLKTVYVRYTDNNDSGYTFSANVILAAAAAVTPNGDVNGDGLVDIKDALKAMQISIGLTTPTLAELVRGDVAPFKNGIPVPDGVIDIVDVLLILRRAIGLVTW